MSAAVCQQLFSSLHAVVMNSCGIKVGKDGEAAQCFLLSHGLAIMFIISQTTHSRRSPAKWLPFLSEIRLK